jgi:hypothetical protein
MRSTDEVRKNGRLIEIRPRPDDSPCSRIVSELERHFAPVVEEPLPAPIARLLQSLTDPRN